MKVTSYPRRVSTILLLAVIAVFAVPTLASAAVPRNIFVEVGGTGNGTLLDPYGSIKTALTNAVAGDTIYIGEGTFTGCYTLKHNVPLVGRGADKTILQGDGTGSVLYIYNAASSVSGCTITGGTGTVTGVWNTQFYRYDSKRVGGAIVALGNSSLRIENNVIRNNDCWNYQAGLGGAIFVQESTATIINNTITNNRGGYGGAIYVHYGYPSTIQNNIISNNTCAGYGGGIYYFEHMSGSITNNLIINNTAGYNGGGIYTDYGSGVKIVNNTIAGNAATWGGGGIEQVTSGAVKNCIIWGNIKTGTTTPSNISAQTKPTYSCVQGGVVGTGNIASDPLFVSAATGDYSLQVSSPAVNTGTATDAPTTDFLGTTRPQGSGYDMGALERTASELTVPLLSQAVTVTFPAAWASNTTTAEKMPLAAGQTPPTGSLLLGDSYYDISTTADRDGTSATVTLSFDDTGLSDTEKASIKLYHYTSGGTWENITNQGGLNLSSKTVSGTTTSFSGFGVFYTEDAPVVPEEPEDPETPLTTTPASSGWSIALTAAMGLMIYRRSRKQS